MQTYGDISWNAIYSIGNEGIDDQHAQIFALANNVLRFPNDTDRVHKAIKKVVDYTQEHFKSEEEYMEFAGYPYLVQHKQLHKNLIKDLHTFLKQLPGLSNEEAIEGLQKFLLDRIVTHIIIEDKKVQHNRADRSRLRELFQWKNSYKIGQEMIDEEHKRLFAIAAKALNYHQNGHAKSFAKQTVKELHDYMYEHFEHEEGYMQEIGFDELEYHKKLHKKIMQQLGIFLQEVPTMDRESFERKLIEYIDIWLVHHIIVEDKKIAQFKLRKKYSS